MRQMAGEVMASVTDGMADIDFGDGVTDEMIEAVMESGNQDAIEALLRGEYIAPDVEENTEVKTPAVQKETEPGEEVSVASDAEPEEQNIPAATEKVDVASKDGKRTIPYQVLDDTRQRAIKAESELNELREKLSTVESKSQKIATFLQSKGINAEEITNAQAESLTAEDLAQLEGLDPIVGKAIRVLSESVNKVSQPVTQQPGESAETIALRGNADLSGWLESDPDRWQFALSVDKNLSVDPKFQSLSFTERFAEVAKRTKAAFGDDVPAKQEIETKKPSVAEVAAQKVAEATKASIPRSLSSIGQTPASERSITERLADMSAGELANAMALMTPAQIEAALAGIS